MKRFLLYTLLAVPFWAAGQGTSQKSLPEFTYITPDMTKKQVDSLIAALSPYELSLEFDTLEYDDNNRIKKINGSLYSKNEYFLVSSGNFKGMTIINKDTTVAVVMGLYYPPQKKK